MSFDLGVWYSSEPISDQEAEERHVALTKEGNLATEPHESVAKFVEELTSRYPQIDDVPENEIDNCPWSVEFDLSEGHVTMPIMWTHVEDVAPLVLELAAKYGLVCYDPQARRVHLPPQLKGK